MFIVSRRAARSKANGASRNTSKMKHLAAYLLLGLAGNDAPSAGDITKVLESVGIDADSDRLETLLSELKDKDIQEVRLPFTRLIFSEIIFGIRSMPRIIGTEADCCSIRLVDH